jgi:protein SCO1
MYRIVFLRNYSWLLLILLIACNEASTVASLPYYNTPDFTPHFIAASEAKQRINHTIAPFSFTDQFGNTINNKTVAGKIHVANFIFTSCASICPKMTNNLKLVDSAFANDKEVMFLSYSVTPWIDSVPRLKVFAENYKINNPNWHLLTADKGAIYTLARRSYFAEEDLGFTKDSTEFLHTEHTMLVDRTGRIRGIYNGTLQLEMEQLIKDIRVLKKEGN